MIPEAAERIESFLIKRKACSLSHMGIPFSIDIRMREDEPEDDSEEDYRSYDDDLSLPRSHLREIDDKQYDEEEEMEEDDDIIDAPDPFEEDEEEWCVDDQRLERFDQPHGFQIQKSLVHC